MLKVYTKKILENNRLFNVHTKVKLYDTDELEKKKKKSFLEIYANTKVYHKQFF